jgi:hypothetical protein
MGFDRGQLMLIPGILGQNIPGDSIKLAYISSLTGASSLYIYYDPDTFGGRGIERIAGTGNPYVPSVYTYTQSAGKKYWEVYILDGNFPNNREFQVGLVPEEYSENFDLEADGFYWTTNTLGEGRIGQAINPPFEQIEHPRYAFTSGDYLRFAYDFSTGNMWLGKNGQWIDGDPSTGQNPSIYVPPMPFDMGFAIFQVGGIIFVPKFNHLLYYPTPAKFSLWTQTEPDPI